MKNISTKLHPKRTREALLKRLTAVKNLKNLPHLLRKVGEPPGTLFYTGTAKIPTQVDLMTYNVKQSELKPISDIHTLRSEMADGAVNWINISGLQNTEIIGAVGKMFNIHPLILEDILNVEQQPKFEDYEDYHFATLKMLSYHKETESIISEHFSMVVKDNLVISFGESAGILFNPLRERILTTTGPLRERGSSYLAYRLIDTIVDHYYHAINPLDEQLESQETRLLKNPERDQIHDILHLKKQVLVLRRATEPLADGMRKALNLDTGIWKEEEKVFVNDVYDHIQRMYSTLELQRETLISLTDLYMSVLSNKMNEAMKTLTTIATIFIPLTFIAGIYGMNFRNMPELEWDYGYFGVLGVMLLVGVLMTLYMKKRHWF